MADKSFGVKDINLIGASGTPTIESPNNLNLNAVTVAISTDVTIGGQITSDIDISGDLNVSGIVTSIGGFVSTASTTPVTITWSGSNLTFSVAGIGSTTLTLS